MARLIGILMLAGALNAAMPTVPRPSPEFVIHPPSGPETLLSGYRGKVVALEFIQTTCPHCQHSVQLMTRLYAEVGKDGFQPLAVAWNDNAAELVPNFVRQLGVTFPVGVSDRNHVLTYLGFDFDARVAVPQIVWIDRKGIIRSETPPPSDEKMLQESYWREMLAQLLKEPAPATHAKTARKPVVR